MHRVVVVGGGFAGLNVVRGLRRSPVDVTLVDRRNHHLFQPLLYQVATGALSPANIAAPLRNLLRRQQNATVCLDEVTGIDVAARELILVDGRMPYDTLVLAAGSTHSYFGHDEWSDMAPGLKSIEDATTIRARILSAFEEAERTADASEIGALLTFVIVGAGPTGVEMAGAIAEIAKDTLRYEFRRINPSDARIVLVEGTDRVLQAFEPVLSAKAADGLRKLGVDVRLNARVTGIEETAVTILSGGATERLATRTVIWAAGIQASGLGKIVAAATGAAADRAGRVPVEPDFTIAGHPEIFVIGDMAAYAHLGGAPLPALAPVAMQEGQYVAKLVHARLTGDAPPAAFRYRDFGVMATIGRMKAVAQLGGRRFSGIFAWLLWLFVHLMQIVQFESRILVLVQWASHYVTHNRGARLITENWSVRRGSAEPRDKPA